MNSDELRSVIQSVVFSNRYVQQYEKYSLQTATDFYNENKTEFDAKGISPSVSFANDVSAIFKTTSTVGNSNNQSSVIQGDGCDLRAESSLYSIFLIDVSEFIFSIVGSIQTLTL